VGAARFVTANDERRTVSIPPNDERRAESGISLVLDVRAELGEGPVWDPVAACLYFVDILRGHVHQFDPATNTSRIHQLNRMVGAVAPTECGDLILAVQDGFARLDPTTGGVTVVARVNADQSDLRMNDGKCDPAGRFWAGTMALDERSGAGSLYCLDVDGRVHTMVHGVTISNGLDWSGDGRVMYYVDSPTHSIDAFDFDAASGAIANRRTVVRVPPEEGIPDGLTLDEDDCIWVALWGGGVVHRYLPDGTRDQVLHVGARYTTSCTFGGSDLCDLYITSSTLGMSPDERAAQPEAGGLFRARPGPKGRPAHRFKG
jgi:sugar lactone lactonase YvrE